MNIEQSAVVLRPRGHWEAMDLGVLFARRHFLSLWLLWCATAIPGFLLINLCLHDFPDWITVAFWWFKPLFEAPLVVWLGQAMFNHPPPVSEQLKQLPAIMKSGILQHLSWRRLSFSRSFNMPVFHLEQLQGNALAQRLTTLHSTNPHSSWLTTLLIHIESGLYLAVPMLIYLLMPGEVEISLEDFFFESTTFSFLENLLYLATVSVVAPFYVSAGFMLYINARTKLEAWDIEIAFRQMPTSPPKAQISSRLACLLLVLNFGVFSLALTLAPVPTQAADSIEINREQAKHSINTVLEHDIFGKLEKVSSWEAINNKVETEKELDWPWLDWLKRINFNWIGIILKYTALSCIAALLIWMLLKIVEYFDPAVLRRNHIKWSKKQDLPAFLTIDNPEQRLPDNPVSAVTALCDQGHLREALSLLYRVSLAQIIKRYRINIPDSATETECLQLVRHSCTKELIHYFAALTRAWQWLAWARQTPAEHSIRQLCNDWPLYFEDASE